MPEAPETAEAAPALQTILVLMGGASGEHDVSLATGEGVLKALDARRYRALPAILGRDNKSIRFSPPWELAGNDLPFIDALDQINVAAPAAAFIAMHGPWGEDGRVQALLEWLDIPYVGSDSFASALAMDKPHSKDVFRRHGIPTPRDAVYTSEDGDNATIAGRVAKDFDAPWVLKTPRLGSSVGVDIIEQRAGLDGAVKAIMEVDGRLMVESYLRGREFTAPVLDVLSEGAPRALPVIEIRAPGRVFFDYESKYDGTLNEEICPAEIPDSKAREIQELGLRAHVALGCRGYSRTDILEGPEGRLEVIETNTLPGLTGESLYPKAAAAVGLPYGELLTSLIDDAIERASLR